MDDMQMEVDAHAAAPWATMWCVRRVKVFEKNSRGWCICLHLPSVAVDRYRL